MSTSITEVSHRPWRRLRRRVSRHRAAICCGLMLLALISAVAVIILG
jgi:hypothetical protein